MECRRPYKCPGVAAGCKLSHALVWITCHYRLGGVSADGILDFLSFGIKISFCLAVCDALCWPSRWMWCEIGWLRCCGSLGTLLSWSHIHTVAPQSALICLFLPFGPCPLPLSPLLSVLVLSYSFLPSPFMRPFQFHLSSPFSSSHLSFCRV